LGYFRADDSTEIRVNGQELPAPLSQEIRFIIMFGSFIRRTMMLTSVVPR
jgi:hypothetical protein